MHEQCLMSFEAVSLTLRLAPASKELIDRSRIGLCSAQITSVDNAPLLSDVQGFPRNAIHRDSGGSPIHLIN